MNQEIPYLINSLYKACYDDKKTHDFFEKDDLELHFIFKDNSDLSQPIKNNEIVDKIIKTIENKELINNMTDLYILSVQNQKKILKLKING